MSERIVTQPPFPPAAGAAGFAATGAIEQLLPERATLSLEEAAGRLEAIRSGRGDAAFSDAFKRFCATLSRDLLSDPRARAHPQLTALGYWIRPAAIRRLEEHYRAGERPGLVRVPRGLVFHLPPANVDTLFVYAWLLSLAVGNGNLVRLSAETTPAGGVLLGLIERALRPSDLRRRTMIVTYEKDDRVTAALSERVDMRCVWGGDAKVAAIRGLPLPPGATEIGFPDRFSMTAVRSEAFLALDQGARRELAEKFFNDVFWFNQMGCASPRLVVWVGTREAGEGAAAALFASLSAVVRAKGYRVELGVALDKITFAYRSMLDLPVRRVEFYDNELCVLTLEELLDVRAGGFGGGTLMQVAVDGLSALVDFVDRKDQTLTQFGFSDDELRGLIRDLRGRGIDRVVPIGKALEFHHVWDGFDLMNQFTRLVQIG